MSRTPVVAVAAVLVLAGCGADGEASDPEPILPSSSPAEPSPSEPSESEDAGEAPVMPDAAKERSREGVEAFLGYWGEALTYSENTGDLEPLREISEPRCESCQGAIDFLASLYEDGGTAEVGGWEVKQVGFAENLGVSSPVVRFRRGLEIVSPSGEDAQRAPAASTTLQFELTWSDSSWSVARYYAVD